MYPLYTLMRPSRARFSLLLLSFAVVVSFSTKQIKVELLELMCLLASFSF